MSIVDYRLFRLYGESRFRGARAIGGEVSMSRAYPSLVTKTYGAQHVSPQQNEGVSNPFSRT